MNAIHPAHFQPVNELQARGIGNLANLENVTYTETMDYQNASFRKFEVTDSKFEDVVHPARPDAQIKFVQQYVVMKLATKCIQ